MLKGHGSIISVAEHIAKDFEGRRLIRRRNLWQVLNKVIDREESFINDDGNSYIWWEIGLEYGEATPILDLKDVPRSGFTFIAETVSMEGPNELIGLPSYLPDGAIEYFMITNGISFGQRILTKFSGGYSRYSSYYEDDWDAEISSEIIYAKQSNAIDIPFTIENTFIAPKARRIFVEPV